MHPPRFILTVTPSKAAGKVEKQKRIKKFYIFFEKGIAFFEVLWYNTAVAAKKGTSLRKRNRIWRDIEVVITGLTRNQFVPKAHEGSNPSLSARKKHTFVYQDNVCFFQLNPPLAEAIHLRWMKSLRDEIPLTR